jgi:hypothetical protein
VFDSWVGWMARQLAALILSCWREFHGGRHFGDVRSTVGPKSRRRHPLRGRAGLCVPNRRTRILRASHGDMSVRQGMGQEMR